MLNILTQLRKLRTATVLCHLLRKCYERLYTVISEPTVGWMKQTFIHPFKECTIENNIFPFPNQMHSLEKGYYFKITTVTP